MRVHKYQITVYERMDWTHRGTLQTRLYIPNQGVFAFKSRKNMDFFADDPEAIADAEKCISGKSDIEGGVKYLGQIELPDEAIAKAISAGKALNQARTTFQESARTLVDLLRE